MRTTQSAGVSFQLKTGHGFYRPHTGPGGVVTDLRPTGLTPDAIETGIVQDILAFQAAGGSLPRVGTPGFIRPLERVNNVSGFRIGYRAVELGPNSIGVSTYYLIP